MQHRLKSLPRTAWAGAVAAELFDQLLLAAAHEAESALDARLAREKPLRRFDVRSKAGQVGVVIGRLHRLSPSSRHRSNAVTVLEFIAVQLGVGIALGDVHHFDEDFDQSFGQFLDLPTHNWIVQRERRRGFA